MLKNIEAVIEGLAHCIHLLEPILIKLALASLLGIELWRFVASVVLGGAE